MRGRRKILEFGLKMGLLTRGVVRFKEREVGHRF